MTAEQSAARNDVLGSGGAAASGGGAQPLLLPLLLSLLAALLVLLAAAALLARRRALPAWLQAKLREMGPRGRHSPPSSTCSRRESEAGASGCATSALIACPRVSDEGTVMPGAAQQQQQQQGGRRSVAPLRSPGVPASVS